MNLLLLNPFIILLKENPIMCCGQKRSATQSSPTRPTGRNIQQDALAAVRYVKNSPIRVRGPVTGRYYEFSGSRPVQSVDARDASSLLNTRFFRRA